MTEIKVFEQAYLATNRAQAVAEISRNDSPHRQKYQGISWHEDGENVNLTFSDMTDDELETLGIDRNKLLNHVLQEQA